MNEHPKDKEPHQTHGYTGEKSQPYGAYPLDLLKNL
jgi:hypothetical protein